MRTVRWPRVGKCAGAGISRLESVELCLSQQGGRNLVMTAPVPRFLWCWLDEE